jgi:hypothetical protein
VDPILSARGSLHCDLDTDDGELTRAAVLGDAIARLGGWLVFGLVERCVRPVDSIMYEILADF